MANAASKSAPKNISEGHKPYVVRVEVYDADHDNRGCMLSIDLKSFENAGDAITYAQKIRRKFCDD